MNFISTKDLAENWGISKRRVVELASQGRIEGSKLVGGAWLFPEDAKKPEDPRKKRQNEQSNPNGRYVFPFILACVHSSEQIDNFTADENALYQLCLTYEKGDFVNARHLAEKLLMSENKYIRIGALYHLPVICMYLKDFPSIEKYHILLHAEYSNITEHKKEIQFILDSLDSELVGVYDYKIDLDCSDYGSYSVDLIAGIACNKLFSEITQFYRGTCNPDLALYELLCRTVDSQGYFFHSMYLHSLLSLYYAVIGETEKETSHLKRAIEIVVQHDTLFTFSYTVALNIDIVLKELKDYPPELSERVLELGNIFISTRQEYAEFKGIKNKLSTLNKADYELISCCLKEYSIDKMAEHFGLSRSGINRRLSHLYSKLGVDSKNELVRVYMNSAINWGKD